MTFEINLDDDEIRRLIADYVVEEHGMPCEPGDIIFAFTPGDGKDQLPWLTVDIRGKR